MRGLVRRVFDGAQAPRGAPFGNAGIKHGDIGQGHAQSAQCHRQTGRIAGGKGQTRAGIDPETPPPPGEALIATNATLPPPLRHLKQDQPKTPGAVASIPLRIAFPPQDARIDLGIARGLANAEQLVMKATGGAAPFTWLVNGKPVVAESPRRQASWAPDGAGVAQVSIGDARGATASVKVRRE